MQKCVCMGKACRIWIFACCLGIAVAKNSPEIAALGPTELEAEIEACVLILPMGLPLLKIGDSPGQIQFRY